MTIQEVLNQIHIKYEFNTDFFDMANEDQKVRLALVNDKINMWENENGILWRELYTTVSDTLDSNGSFNLTNFILPANRLEIGSDYYEYISPELLQEQQKFNSNAKVYTVTGGVSDKTLTVYPNPGPVGFSLRYYKKATTYLTGTETTELEMSDPYFVIYSVVAELYLDDGDTEKSSVAIQIATQKLEGMKSKNAAVPVFVDTKQPDYQFKGFGN